MSIKTINELEWHDGKEISKPLTGGLRGLKVREWIYPCCGEVHYRDLNASKNILKEGLKVLNSRDV